MNVDEISVEVIQRTLALDFPTLTPREKVAGHDGYILAGLSSSSGLLNMLKAVSPERIVELCKRDNSLIPANMPYFVPQVVDRYRAIGQPDVANQILATLPGAISRLEQGIADGHFGNGHSLPFAKESLETLKKYHARIQGETNG